MPDPMNDDVVIACADLAARAGALSFALGYAHDDVPIADADWHVEVTYRGARLFTDGHRSPATAALAMAERLLTGAECKCGRAVALSDRAAGCRWRLVGAKWVPGCDDPPLHAKGLHGDLSAIRDAADRRAEG